MAHRTALGIEPTAVRPHFINVSLTFGTCRAGHLGKVRGGLHQESEPAGPEGSRREPGESLVLPPLYKRVLAIWEKGLGPEHPKVVTNLKNIVGLHSITDRGQAAEAL